MIREGEGTTQYWVRQIQEEAVATLQAKLAASEEECERLRVQRDEALRKLEQARELLNQIGGPRSEVNQVATTPPEPD